MSGQGSPLGNSCCSQLQMPYFYGCLPVATEGTVQELGFAMMHPTLLGQPLLVN